MHRSIGYALSRKESMKFRLPMRAAMLLTLLGMLAGTYAVLRDFASFVETPDFDVYYTAACLVRNHQSPAIYEDARLNDNPIVGIQNRQGAYSQTAVAHGINGIGLYIYPPTLADLLVPFTWLSPLPALIVWELLSIAAAIAAAVLLTRTVGLYSLAPALLAIFVLFAFRPIFDCLYNGQIACVLLLLLVAAISLYAGGHRFSAALLFSLAIAIKLTPLIVIVPFIAWRDWKILRFIALWCLAVFAALVCVNGWPALSMYMFDVMPKMTRFVLNSENRSLSMAIHSLWFGRNPAVALTGLSWAERFASALVLGLAGWLSRTRHPGEPKIVQRIEAIAIFLLLACCLSPVSWTHMYALSAPALLLFARRAWQGHAHLIELLILMAFAISLSVEGYARMLVTTPMFGMAYSLLRLSSLSIEQDSDLSCGKLFTMPS
jgi:hypothetical protein